MKSTSAHRNNAQDSNRSGRDANPVQGQSVGPVRLRHHRNKATTPIRTTDRVKRPVPAKKFLCPAVAV